MSLQIDLTTPSNLEYLLNMDFQPLIPLLKNKSCSLAIPPKLDMIPQVILEKFAEKIANIQSEIPFFLQNINILFQVMEDEKIVELLTQERVAGMSNLGVFYTFRVLQCQNKIQSIEKLWGLYEKLDNKKMGSFDMLRRCEYNPITKELIMNESQKFIIDKFESIILFVKLKLIAPIPDENELNYILEMSGDTPYWNAYLELLGIKQSVAYTGAHTNKNNVIKDYYSTPESGHDAVWVIELPNKELVQDFLLVLDNMIVNIQRNINKL